MKKFDEDIILAIKQGTDGAAGQKDAVWDDIQRRMEAETMKETKRKRRNAVWKGIAAVVLAGAVFTAVSPSGRAAAGKLIDLFDPHKTIDFELEGQPESGDFELHTGGETATPAPGKEAVRYVIYVDESRYYTETVDGADRIVPLDFPEDYPPTYMEIRQDTERTPDEIAADLAAQLKTDYETVVEPEPVTYPLNAVHLRARNGSEWNSPVVSYFLIDNTVGGTFIVEEHYFLEAEEGHAARFGTMLTQFQIVPAAE